MTSVRLHNRRKESRERRASPPMNEMVRSRRRGRRGHGHQGASDDTFRRLLGLRFTGKFRLLLRPRLKRRTLISRNDSGDARLIVDNRHGKLTPITIFHEGATRQRKNSTKAVISGNDTGDKVMETPGPEQDAPRLK